MIPDTHTIVEKTKEQIPHKGGEQAKSHRKERWLFSRKIVSGIRTPITCDQSTITSKTFYQAYLLYTAASMNFHLMKFLE